MRAMILAAGRGERMRPLTDHTPKPLLEVHGKPLIVWHIERLVAAGIREIIINHAWLGEQIEQRLGDGDRFNARLSYSPESIALETAGGIAQALDFFGGSAFIVVNGDIWCDWDPGLAPSIAAAMQKHAALASLVLVDNPAHHPKGDFELTAAGLVQDASQRDGHSTLTFSGIGIYHPALFAALPKGVPAPLAPLLRASMPFGQVIGRRHAGNWVDVGTPQRLAELNQCRDLARPPDAGPPENHALH
jgi:MurNAc alpha-1-phosphate uridylyltransferase